MNEENNSEKKEIEEERKVSSSLIVSVYDKSDEYENRLQFWLQLDHWTLKEAAALISDIDPESVELTPDQQNFAAARSLREIELLGEDENEEEDDMSVDNNGCPVIDDPYLKAVRLRYYYRTVRDIERIIGGIHPKVEVAPPKEWISIALSRGIHIPWLQWAERVRLVKGFLKPNVSNDTQVSDTPVGEKERRSMLKIIAALCEMEKLDKHKVTKNAKVIQNQCLGLGFAISENTIVKYLRQAAELIPEN